MTQGKVISLNMTEMEMGNHGSKSDIFWSVKEQRVDSSSISYKDGVRCILVAGKPVFLFFV